MNKKEQKKMKLSKNMVKKAIVTMTLLFVIAAACVVSAKSPEQYPSKAITLIVPFSAGGISDYVARLISDVSRKYTNQPINVVNVPGGSAVVGSNQVITAPPDGYTLGLLSSGEAASALNILKAPYDLNSYTPFCQVGKTRYVLAVNKNAKWNTLKEFIDYAKKNPKKVNVATPGKGTITYLTGEYFCDKTGIELNFVPFQGSGPIVPALLGNHVDAAFFSVIEILSSYKAKEVKLLATINDKRIPVVNDVPTAKEQGYNIVAGGSHYVVGPNGVPAGTAKAICKLIQQVTSDEKYINSVMSMGYTPEYAGTQASKKTLKNWHDQARTIYQKLGMLQ
jgi:tripartite-type tricarboxylate transporter receptor subunit TctC